MELIPLTLHARAHEYGGVHSFHFLPAAGARLPRYEAGMYVHLVAPGGGISRETVRHMSFASAPSEGLLTFAMDVSSETVFKKAMAAMKPGDACQMFKIKFKHFMPVWNTTEREVVFIAGGLGITPIRSLLKQHHSALDWELIHVARGGNHLYETDLSALGGRQTRTDHAGAANVIASAVETRPKAWFYVCGSQRFMDGMVALLQKAGVPEEKIRKESFN